MIVAIVAGVVALPDVPPLFGAVVEPDPTLAIAPPGFGAVAPPAEPATPDATVVAWPVRPNHATANAPPHSPSSRPTTITIGHTRRGGRDE